MAKTAEEVTERLREMKEQLKDGTYGSPFQKKKILTHDQMAVQHATLSGAAVIPQCVNHEAAGIALDIPPENDAGNARLLIDQFGQELRFLHAFDSWLIWDGNRWKRDEDGGIHRLGLRLSHCILADAIKLPITNSELP
jgi:hypothetical protein